MTEPAALPRKVTLGLVGRALARFANDPRARGNAKALALAEAAKTLRAFAYKDLLIFVLEPPSVVPMANGHIALSVVVGATRNGIAVPVDNPYLFVNPPTLVPSQAAPDEMVEDLEEAFRQMVGDAVRIVGTRT